MSEPITIYEIATGVVQVLHAPSVARALIESGLWTKMQPIPVAPILGANLEVPTKSETDQPFTPMINELYLKADPNDLAYTQEQMPEDDTSDEAIATIDTNVPLTSAIEIALADLVKSVAPVKEETKAADAIVAKKRTGRPKKGA